MLDIPAIPLASHHQTIVARFVAVCRADERVLAAFLGGSYARKAADRFSDLDLFLITSDESFDDFKAQRDEFMRKLGEPLFLEDFDIPNIVFYILKGGAEGELSFSRASDFTHMHVGPYKILLDKQDILDGAVFTGRSLDPAHQREQLRRLITWFWHELSHFITALGRGKLWWAQGQVEALRNICLGLARLQNDPADHDAGDEPYFKIEYAIPVERLYRLRSTFCALEPAEMYTVILQIVQLYRELAMPLAEANRIAYPEELERLMLARLEELKPIAG